MDQSNQTQPDLQTLIAAYMQRPIRLEEAAEYLGVSKSYLYKLTSKSEIPHYKPNGKTIYFRREDLEKWALRRKVASREEVRHNVQSR
ncbi:MAG: helix-turn-helix domain-containing protein [Bacteroidota bacterium]